MPVKPKLIQKDVTRYYEIPHGPFETPEDVVKSFRYELIKELDRGSYGIVYFARDLRKKKDVACKIIDMGKLKKLILIMLFNFFILFKDPNEESALKDNKNELMVMETVRHPYVIPLYCHFIVKGPNICKLYIFMEFADGGNLYKYLQKQKKLPSEAKSKLYFAQIVSGINHIHSFHIAHRDIKLANILLSTNPASPSGDYVLLVTDFGLSKMVNSSNKLFQTVCGTPVYMAPELFINKPYDPYSVDMWALGVCLYQILSMQLPFNFRGRSQHSVVNDMLNKRFNFDKFSTTPSEEFQDLVCGLLDPNPQNRLTIKDILKHEWISEEIKLAQKLKKQLIKSRSESYQTKIRSNKSIHKKSKEHEKKERNCKEGNKTNKNKPNKKSIDNDDE